MRSSYLVCYDIADDKRLRRVFKTMRGWGDHLQFSVFEYQLTAADFVKLRADLSSCRKTIECAHVCRQDLLNRLRPSDPLTIGLWALLLALVALPASLIPALRVRQLDQMNTRFGRSRASALRFSLQFGSQIHPDLEVVPLGWRILLLEMIGT